MAALQVGLRQWGLDAGTVDGVLGPKTAHALETFQRRAGITIDGVPGPGTRRAFGLYGRYELGDRAISLGADGRDVAELQFLLAWHGFPSGEIDGSFGARTRVTLRRFQLATASSSERTPAPLARCAKGWKRR
ncbi:MAG: peptidoglycan-binding protein [Gaiellaceae bacterium]